MQFLLARVMFRQNSKAAMKLLDSTIEDMEAYVPRQTLASSMTFSYLLILLIDTSIYHGSMPVDFCARLSA